MGFFRKLKGWFASIGIGLVRVQAKKHLKSNEPIKDAIHVFNLAVQSRFKMEGDGRQKAVQYARDLMVIAHAYVDAFGDESSPSEISKEELASIDAKWDEMVDKYVPADRVSEWVDAAFDYADALVQKSI